MRLTSIIKALFKKPYVPEPGKIPPSWERYAEYIDIHPTALIAPHATIKFYNLPKTPCKMLKVGAMSHIFGHFALLKEGAEIIVGERCQIGSSHIISSKSILIEDDVIMSWGVTVIDTDTHSHCWDERKNDVVMGYQDYLKDTNNILLNKDWSSVLSYSVCIEKKSWIGFNSIILKGVHLAEGTIVGAGAVVTKSFDEKGKSLGGNPAKILKD